MAAVKSCLLRFLPFKIAALARKQKELSALDLMLAAHILLDKRNLAMMRVSR